MKENIKIIDNDPEIEKKILERYKPDEKRFQSEFTIAIPDDVFKNSDLSPSQFRVLFHVFNCTIGFRKLWDRIGLSHFKKHTHLAENTIREAIYKLNTNWIYAVYKCRSCGKFFDKAYLSCPLCECYRSYYAYYSPILNEELIQRYKKIFKVKQLDDFMTKNDIPLHFLRTPSSIYKVGSRQILRRTTKQTKYPLTKQLSDYSEISDITEFTEKLAFTEKVIAFWDGLRLSNGWKPLARQGKQVTANQKRIAQDWYGIYTLPMIKSVLSAVVNRFVLTNIGETIQSLRYFEKALDKEKNPSPSTPATPSPTPKIKKVSEGLYRQV